MFPPFAMIIVTKPEATEDQIQHIIERIEEWGFKTDVSRGEHRTVIGVIGEEGAIREKPIAAIAGVESVTPVLKPYKLVAREFRGGTNSVVKIGDVRSAARRSSSCADRARSRAATRSPTSPGEIKKAGAKILRGGAFKPRTSPYAFQGLGEDGLKLLAEAREATGLPVITEIMDTKHLEVIEQYADCLQVGARNMQNFSLLKEVGRSKLPVMLKRGMSATIKDLLMSAEYILSEGNFNVLLCERGIRTFETYTRNTLDLNAVPGAESGDASARRRRSHPRHRPARTRREHGAGRRRRRRGRDHDRSAQQPGTRQERWRAGPPAPRVPGSGGARAQGRRSRWALALCGGLRGFFSGGGVWRLGSGV